MAEEKTEHTEKKQQRQQGPAQNKPGQQQGNPAHSQPNDDTRIIIRVQGVDLNGSKTVQRGLTKIKGIGVMMARNIGTAFSNYSGSLESAKLGTLNEEQVKKLEEVIQNPKKFGVPEWSLNRRKDFYSGGSSHITMAELDLTLRSDLQRMGETKSYKGLRHMWGQPVRGQKTKSTHRGTGPVVGVTKKDIKQQAAPKPASGPAPKSAAGAKPAAGKK